MQILQDPAWPAEIPFEAEDFQKYDESPDTQFYAQVRMALPVSFSPVSQKK